MFSRHAGHDVSDIPFPRAPALQHVLLHIESEQWNAKLKGRGRIREMQRKCMKAHEEQFDRGVAKLYAHLLQYPSSCL